VGLAEEFQAEAAAGRAAVIRAAMGATRRPISAKRANKTHWSTTDPDPRL
jgi:hypothetical protein